MKLTVCTFLFFAVILFGGFSFVQAQDQLYKPARWVTDGQKLTMSFSVDGENLEDGFEIGLGLYDKKNRQGNMLLGWRYSDGAWSFDATELCQISHYKDDALVTGLKGQPVSCTITLDASGYWAFGTLTDREGNVTRSRVYTFPAAHAVRKAGSTCVMMSRADGAQHWPVSLKTIKIEVDRPKTHAPWNIDTRMPITVIEFGWTSPDSTYLHDNIREMEKRPLDGVTVRVASPRFPGGTVLCGTGLGDLGWAAFMPQPLPQDDIDLAIADMNDTDFQKFKSNYLLIANYFPENHPSWRENMTIDWFDDAWCQIIANNLRQLSEAAYKGGCEGILFDTEHYGYYFWRFENLKMDPAYENKTYEEVAAKIHQRGKEFMAAINNGYPGVNILFLHAWERLLEEITIDDMSLYEHHDYGLLKDFLDGMLEAADSKTIFIDGMECGYWTDTVLDAKKRVNRVRRFGPAIVSDPEKFKRQVRLGFGIWLDRGGRWYPSAVASNPLPPHKYTKMIKTLLEESDGFVWLYSEKPSWWLDSPNAKFGGGVKASTGVGNYAKREGAIKWIPRSYWDAVQRARKAVEDGRKNFEN